MRLTETRSALLVLAAMAAVIAGALAFQHIGGYIPCALCLEQRTPYYAAMPVALLAVLASAMRGPAWLSRGLLAACALFMLYGAALGGYHAGVEWGWWPGPTDCGATAAGGIPDSAGDLLSDLSSTRPPSCDEAALRVAGLSLAGWNVLTSLAIAAVALRAAWLGRRA